MNIDAFYGALKTTNYETVDALVKKHLADGMRAQQILNEGLIAAMSIVGREFKEAAIWVPEVILAARNMQHGINLLKPVMASRDVVTKGKFLIGTVRGDIHDIGKNVVSVMMYGSSFEVVDLGVSVSPEEFMEAVFQHQPEVVGLSALLTTTMMEMEEVVALIKTTSFERRPKVIIGGAPVTQEFADEIGADGYGENAMAAVELATNLCNSQER